MLVERVCGNYLPQQLAAAFFNGQLLFVAHEVSDLVAHSGFAGHAASAFAAGHLHSSAHLHESVGQVHFSAQAQTHAPLAGSADCAIP